MSYTIQQKFIHKNRSGKSLVPQGIVFHDTDTPGATANNEYSYFNRVYAAASAHYFVDWNGIIQTVPTNEQAWHAGPSANHRFLSIEMCTPAGYNKAQFDAMYARAIWLGKYLMNKYGFSISQVHSHKWCSNTWHETDHQDPDAFLAKYGKSWNQLLSDLSGSHSTVTTTPTHHSGDYGIGQVTARSGLRVRKGPGTNFGLAGSALSYGSKVRIANVSNGWASIYYGQHGGWVSMQYIKMLQVFSEPVDSHCSKSIYKVIVGSFLARSKAACLQDKLKKAEFDCYIAQHKCDTCTLYRVCAGSYAIKSNAVKQQFKLKSAGFTSFLLIK